MTSDGCRLATLALALEEMGDYPYLDAYIFLGEKSGGGAHPVGSAATFFSRGVGWASLRRRFSRTGKPWMSGATKVDKAPAIMYHTIVAALESVTLCYDRCTYSRTAVRVWPSGKAADFGSAIPRFESWHPSQLLFV